MAQVRFATDQLGELYSPRSTFLLWFYILQWHIQSYLSVRKSLTCVRTHRIMDCCATSEMLKKVQKQKPNYVYMAAANKLSTQINWDSSQSPLLSQILQEILGKKLAPWSAVLLGFGHQHQDDTSPALDERDKGLADNNSKRGWDKRSCSQPV